MVLHAYFIVCIRRLVPLLKGERDREREKERERRKEKGRVIKWLKHYY